MKRVIILSIINSLVVSAFCIPFHVPSWAQMIMCGFAGGIIAFASNDKG
jgi:hypothetical protein